jgi:anaerobic selenocysteine-containing dehydrogenase
MTDATLTSTCPLDCPDSCVLDITVWDDRIVKITGAADPVTAGFVCAKVRRFDRQVYATERLRRPLRRSGPKGSGSFEPVTWEVAIGEIAARFREVASRSGSEAILPYHYGGSNGMLTDGFLDTLFFARLGASRLLKTLCAAPATAVATGMYGKMPGVAFQDYVQARCIILWGGNPKASNIHLVPFIKEARRRGAFVAVVDPVRTFGQSEADLHLPVHPGTDLPLALAMIGLWRDWGCLDSAFLSRHTTGAEVLLDAAESWTVERAADVTGVGADHIRTLARAYADASPAVIRCGWGLERNRHGGQAIAAILAMPALLGKFGVRGGGYTLSNNGATRFDAEPVLGMPPWTTRAVNMSQLGQALAGDLDPPIEAIFVYNCNPAVTAPDQTAVLRGLARADLFTVVFDQLMTDTAQYADIVLPATAFPEHWDIRASYGRFGVGAVRPVIPPPGDARSNHEVFGMLGRAMGFEDPPFSWTQQEAHRSVLAALELEGGTPLERGGVDAVTWEHDFPGPTPIMFGTVWPRTGDGKAHLRPEDLGPDPYRYHDVTDRSYPLALISPATARTISSTMGQYGIPELYVEINSGDAEPRGIVDGDLVRVFNALGEVLCRARVTDRVRPGVVLIPKGAWRRSSRNGLTATALCPDHVNVVGGGACYNDARVEVERRS